MELLFSTPVMIAGKMLWTLAASINPLSPMAAHSERHFPVYLGASPRELSLKVAGRDSRASLPAEAFNRAAIGLEALRKRWVKSGRLRASDSVLIEAWPYRDDYGRYAWAVARWKRSSKDVWQWIEGEVRDASSDPEGARHHHRPPGQLTTIQLPVEYNAGRTRDFNLLFKDMLEQKSLYSKPLAGNCVWTDETGRRAYGAWTDPQRLTELVDALRAAPQDLICRWLPMPAWWNGQPKTWTLRVGEGLVKWPAAFEEAEDHALDTADRSQGRTLTDLSPRLRDQYRADVSAFTGEEVLTFPTSGRSLRLTRQNSAQSDHQLGELVAYLEERYALLGIPTERQEFTWRGIPQANLIAKIPGSLRGRDNKPVLIADHLDTAFAEEVFAATGERRSVPGADDNHAATGALLAAAEMLRGLELKHDVWLVHFTGEEFPADDLGARVFLERALRRGQDFSGLVLMDLIGVRSREDLTFQVQPGDSPESLKLGTVALGAARDVIGAGRTPWEPLQRERFDKKSYIYNTDGVFFTETGYPVVYFNEHMNAWENIERIGYHTMTDRTDYHWKNADGLEFFWDWDYALAIVHSAIETAARMAL